MKKFLIAFLMSCAIIPATTANAAKVETQAPTKYELGNFDFSFQPKEDVTFKETTFEAQPAAQPEEKTIQVKTTSPINAQKEIVKQVKQDAKTMTEDAKELGNSVKTNIEEKADKVENSVKTDSEKIKSELQTKTEKADKTVKTEADKAKVKVEKKFEQSENAVKTQTEKLERTTDKVKEDVQKEFNNIKEFPKEQMLDKTNIQEKKLLEKGKQKSFNAPKEEKEVKFDKNKPPFKFQINQIPYSGTSSSTVERL